ncbi:hypothetical protein EMPS_03709 [Entomortierella parvispora]|uniref:Uncharacterized protein n=1 Tax=Entomortierella parvispora TaxID=205924 RepID=A0A9P3H793_9FUNG|nr:hypothetical protein EMPS_03709 [Entomortierella parvispora]
MDPTHQLASTAIDSAMPLRLPKHSRPKSTRPKETLPKTSPVPTPINGNQWRESQDVQSSYDSGCEGDCDSESDGGVESDNSSMAGSRCRLRACPTTCLWCQYYYRAERFSADHFVEFHTLRDLGPLSQQDIDSEDTTSFSMSYSSSWSMTEE